MFTIPMANRQMVNKASHECLSVGKAARTGIAAAGYGIDKAIFGYGESGPPNYLYVSVTNLVSNTGVVANDTAGVGTARNGLAAASYSS